MTKTQKSTLNKAIAKGTEWKQAHGVELAAKMLWNRFGYMYLVKDGMILLLGAGPRDKNNMLPVMARI